MNGTRVLIVEDELLVAEDIKETLSRNGKFNIEIATDGNKAIDVAKKYKPELVMMDIRLREKPDGIETGLKIREICKPSIIFVTAYADKQTVHRAMNAEPHGFIVKPFTDKDLFATVEVALIRHQIEEALYKREEWTKLIVENLPGVILFKDRSFKYHPINRMFFEVFDKYKNQIINKSDFDIYHYDLAEKIRKEDERLMNKKKSLIKKEMFVELIKKWFNVVKVPIFNKNGEFMGILVSLHDITKEKKKKNYIRLFKNEMGKKDKLIAKKDKRLKKEVYRRILARDLIGKIYNEEKLILDNIPEYMIYYNKLFKIEWINKSALERIGLPYDMIHGKRCHELKLCKLSDIKSCPVYQVLQDGTMKEVEITFNDKIWQVKAFPIKDKDKSLKGVLEIITDITEKKTHEKQSLQNQRIQIVGRLASGIAHDFNNILTVIKGYSELILQDIDQENPLYGDIDEIYQASKRAEILVRKLLTFTKNDTVKKEFVSINEVILSMKNMIERLLEENIVLTLELHPNIPEVYMDKGHIEQIIMNLIVNAKEAMPDGGNLTIKTDVFKDNESTIYNRGDSRGNYITLSVKDTGMGMDEATKSRIFEPFFTSKKKGSGLGLATVNNIVKTYGGFIVVDSEPAKGSRFDVYLRVDELNIS